MKNQKSRCCKCGKVVWFWQASPIAGPVIHAKCHAETLERFIEDHPDCEDIVNSEMVRFNLRRKSKR
jgi:hypothetical protein